MLQAPVPYGATVALLLFIIASITDYLDGYLARKYALITPFGQLMDPLVDKILMAAVFICLIPLGDIPAWAVIIIISRELLITGLRLLAAGQGQVLAAEKLGKHKTGWQMTTAIALLLLEASGEWSYPLRELHPAINLLAVALITITVALTLYSGLAYLWRHRDLLQA